MMLYLFMSKIVKSNYYISSGTNSSTPEVTFNNVINENINVDTYSADDLLHSCIKSNLMR